MISKFIARQLRKPNGLFGRFVMTTMLNRSNRLMNDKVLQLLQPGDGDRILEIGFGGGDLLDRICRAIEHGNITGIDYSRDVIKAAESSLGAHITCGKLDLVCADIESCTFDPGSFNKICGVNTVYFWQDPSRLMQRLQTMLESKGLLFLCFNTAETMNRFQHITRHGFTAYSVDDVKGMLDAAGFINIRIVPGKNHHGEFVVAVGEKY